MVLAKLKHLSLKHFQDYLAKAYHINYINNAFNYSELQNKEISSKQIHVFQILQLLFNFHKFKQIYLTKDQLEQNILAYQVY
jgi:hypothetical protein